MPIRDRVARSMTEARLQADILALLHALGYFTHHEHDSRRGSAGMPDIFAIKGRRVLWIECKSQRGKLRPEQQAVIGRLLIAAQEVYVFRPCDWLDGTVELTLSGRGDAREGSE